MINNELLKEISARITALTPIAANMKEDVEKGIQEILGSVFTRLDLVTREEFDAQLKVLARAEKTISFLEAKVAQLEESQKTSPANAENENL